MGSSPSFQKAGECLYRNPSSGTYYALVKVRGKQFKSSLQTKTLAEARRKLKDYRKDLNRVDPAAGKMSVEALADLYLNTVRHQAAATVRKKIQIAQRIKEKWGALQAKELKTSQIKAWLAFFKFGNDTRNKHLRVVRAMFQLAIDDRILAHSPALGLKEQKIKTPIRKTPTVKEFRAIVRSIRTQPYSDTAKESADLVEFYGLAGLGAAEASCLTWGDVDLKKNQIITFRRKTEAGFAVPIYPQLRPLLSKRFAEAKKTNGGVAPFPETKVFRVANAKKAIKTACERLNLPNYTSRSFRRTFIVTAIEKSIDVKVISEWQGHKDGGKLILGTYSHVRPVHSQRMARLMR